MADSPSLAKELATIALQGYQFLYNGDRFQVGRLVCAYRPDLRHGEIIQVGNFVAYAETVEHSMTALADASLELRTVVTFTRGLTSEDDRTFTDRGVR